MGQLYALKGLAFRQKLLNASGEADQFARVCAESEELAFGHNAGSFWRLPCSIL
jgi:hypothetical protein